MKLKFTIAAIVLGFLPLTNPALAQSADFVPIDVHGDWSGSDFTRAGALPKGWRPNSSRAEGEARWIEDGNGHILELSGNSNALNAFHIYMKDPFPVSEGSVVDGKISARGEGTVRIMIYLYDIDGKHIGSTPEIELKPSEGSAFSVLPFNQVIAAVRKGVPAQARLAVGVSAGESIQVREISAATKEKP